MNLDRFLLYVVYIISCQLLFASCRIEKSINLLNEKVWNAGVPIGGNQ